jgi:hypothetical protein
MMVGHSLDAFRNGFTSVFPYCACQSVVTNSQGFQVA